MQSLVTRSQTIVGNVSRPFKKIKFSEIPNVNVCDRLRSLGNELEMWTPSKNVKSPNAFFRKA
jgi:hypothetical protein